MNEKINIMNEIEKLEVMIKEDVYTKNELLNVLSSISLLAIDMDTHIHDLKHELDASDSYGVYVEEKLHKCKKVISVLLDED